MCGWLAMRMTGCMDDVLSGGGLSCAGDGPWAAGCWMALLSGWLAVRGWLCGWLVVWLACCPDGWLCGWPASRMAGLKDCGDKC